MRATRCVSFSKFTLIFVWMFSRSCACLSWALWEETSRFQLQRFTTDARVFPPLFHLVSELVDG